MPNIKSSVLSVRKDAKTNAANAAELVNLAYKKIDKAAKTNLIHKNAAARYKSNLAK